MNNQKGIAHLLLLLVILLLAGAGVYFLVNKGVIKNPLSNLPSVGTKQPTIAVKSEYKNPFDKGSQYVNPFDQYKSPLLNLKK